MMTIGNNLIELPKYLDRIMATKKWNFGFNAKLETETN